MLSIRTEIIELADAAANLLANGGSLASESYQVACEAVDVVAAIVAAFDETNKSEDLARVKADLAQGIAYLQTRVDLPFWLVGTLPTLGALLVDKLGNFSGTNEQFKREELLPFFQGVEQLGRRGREMLQQLPPGK